MNNKKIYKPISLLIVSLILATSIYALPVLNKQAGSNPIKDCATTFTQEKGFIANTTIYNIGLVCSENSKIHLFECDKSPCIKENKAEIGYKVKNNLPKYTNFTKGKIYFYKCEECIPPGVNIAKNNEELECAETTLGNTKKFVAEQKIINIGLVCKDDALIRLYECLNNDCDQAKPIDEAYKKNGILPKFEGFSVGSQYYYMCSECKEKKEGDKKTNFTQIKPQTVIKEKENQPILILKNDTINIFEGETLDLEFECKNADGTKNTIVEYEGWLNSSTKKTGYEDAGSYGSFIKCIGNNGKTTIKKVTVNVIDSNRKPYFIW